MSGGSEWRWQLSEQSSVCLRLDTMNPNTWHVVYNTCSSKGSLNLHLETPHISHIQLSIHHTSLTSSQLSLWA